MFNYYVYVYLNPLKAGEFNVGKFNFNYEPFYVGKGKGWRIGQHFSKYTCCRNASNGFRFPKMIRA